MAELLLPARGFNWVDFALLAAFVLSTCVGMWRGLVFEVLSLAGWVAAFVAAQLWGDDVAGWLPVGAKGSALNHAAGIAVTFFVALVVWGIASRLVRMMIRATPLSGVDRLLGSVFGAVRALVLALIVATVALMTPAARSNDWQRSTLGPCLTGWVMSLKPMLPAEVVRHLPSSPAPSKG